MSKKVVYDIEYEFTVDSFNISLTEEEKNNVEWAWKKEGGTIQYYSTQGTISTDGNVTKSVQFDKDLVGETIYIMPFLEEPDPAVSIVVEVVEPIFLYLIFYVDEDHRGNTMMAEVAQTRLQNIKNSDWYDDKKHKVHCPPIQSIDEIIDILPRYTEMYGGKGIVFTKESGVVSHSGNDGPISYETEIKICPEKSSWPHQMDMCGWEQIDFNWWVEDTMCVFYGCNSGWKPNGFSKRISELDNFTDVEVWGQSTYSFPSFLPDIRFTSMARNMHTGWFAGETYLVGGNGGEGLESTGGGSRRNEEYLSKFPRANPMNCYKNGTHVRETHQGYFNDHRK